MAAKNINSPINSCTTVIVASIVNEPEASLSNFELLKLSGIFVVPIYPAQLIIPPLANKVL